MGKTITKKPNNITFPKEDFLKLLEAYQKIGQILASKKIKKTPSFLKSLYGIWEGIKVDEKDFEEAKKSLFKSSV